MKQLIDHHHYKKNLITSDDRVAVYERYVIDLILNSTLPDTQRDSSIAFELKHHHSTSQFARVLAKKRGLSEDVCCVGALLHDIYLVENGSYLDHAHKSAKIAKSILDEINLFSKTEKAEIIKIIFNHSDKDAWSNDSYEEFGKDVDILDSFLYHNAYGYYLKHKRLQVFYNYIIRAKSVWDEIGLTTPICFTALDNYNTNWLDYVISIDNEKAKVLLSFLIHIIETTQTKVVIPTFCLKQKGSTVTFYFNSTSFFEFAKIVEAEYQVQLDKFTPENICNTTEIITHEASGLINSLNQQVLIIWASLNSFELIDPIVKPERILDLGITATQQEA